MSSRNLIGKRKQNTKVKRKLRRDREKKMWLEKFILMYLLTMFNSLNGYFLDNQLQATTGRHRRKGKQSAAENTRKKMFLFHFFCVHCISFCVHHCRNWTCFDTYTFDKYFPSCSSWFKGKFEIKSFLCFNFVCIKGKVLFTKYVTLDIFRIPPPEFYFVWR